MDRLVIGILAHVDAGKTTLSEGLLYKCNIIRKLGRVDKKDAFLDNYALERERGITIFSKQACFERGDVSFTLIDTPGHVDFSTEMERALSVLDVAILVISGTDGIQAHTRTLWKLLDMYDIPTFIFVNKMDREDADKDAVLAELKENLSKECVEFVAERVQPKKDVSVNLSAETCEQIAVCDDELMERYLENEVLETDDIRTLIGQRQLFPCIFGSALKLDGVDMLLDSLAQYCPRLDDEQHFSARVYKITRAEDGTRLTHLKVMGGSVRNRDIISYASSETFDDSDSRAEVLNEKITQIRLYNGEKFETTEIAQQGMVVAVAGLTATYAGQALGDAQELPAPKLVPVMTYRVLAADKSHLMQLVPKLKILEEEDPSLNVIWNSEVRELQIQIMGDIQLEILKRTFLERFDEDISFDRGSVLYKETITAPSLGVGHFEPLRHYAEAQLMLFPGERGSGITSDSIVSVNALELNWQRLIFTHIYEREHKGVLTGAALTDIHFTLVAGRSHLKHTEGGDFRQATYRAIRQGLMCAREQGSCILLEPYYELTIELPRSCCGRAMTDIEKKSGKITSQYEIGNADMVGLTGIAPVSTMQGYVKEVSAYTKGLGSMYCTYYGYMPCHNQSEVVEKSGYEPLADLRNPASSVFCAHGAGFVVEWNDVDSYKHLDWDVTTGKLKGESQTDQTGAINYVSHVSDEPWMGVEEVDAIIERTAYGNRREKAYRNPFRKKKTAQESASSAQSKRDVQARQSTGYASKERYLLVDGYNIIFGWPELAELAEGNIDGARERLNDILCDYQTQHNCRLIVVYDAYRVAGHPTEYYKFHNIGVVYTKEAETADKFIERFAHENAKQYDITVATSDGLEQIIIRGAGCKLMTARDLAEDVGRHRNETLDRLAATNDPAVGTRIDAKLSELK